MNKFKTINYIIILIIVLLGINYQFQKIIRLNTRDSIDHNLHGAGEWQVDSIFVNGNWAYFNQTYEWCYYDDGFFIIENVTINTENNNGIIVANTEDHFIIRKCTINNSISGEDSAAIKCISVKNGMLIGNNISDNNGNGILTTMSSNITIQYNNINNNGENGLMIGKSDNFTICNNQINDNGEFGMLFDALYGGGVISVMVDHKVFANEISYNRLSGVKLVFCENCTVKENEIHSNGVYGVHLDFWCSDNLITNNHIIYKQGCIYDKEGSSQIFNNHCALDPSISPLIPGINPLILILVILTLGMMILINNLRRHDFSFSFN